MRLGSTIFVAWTLILAGAGAAAAATGESVASGVDGAGEPACAFIREPSEDGRQTDGESGASSDGANNSTRQKGSGNGTAAESTPEEEAACHELRQELQGALYGTAPDFVGLKRCKNVVGYNVCIGVLYNDCRVWFSFGLGGCVSDWWERL